MPFIPGCKFVFFLPQTFQGFGAIKESQYFQKLETCFCFKYFFLEAIQDALSGSQELDGSH